MSALKHAVAIGLAIIGGYFCIGYLPYAARAAVFLIEKMLSPENFLTHGYSIRDITWFLPVIAGGYIFFNSKRIANWWAKRQERFEPSDKMQSDA